MQTTIMVSEQGAARQGDEVVIVRDALLALQPARRARPTWCLVEAGTAARLVAWHDGVARLVLHDGPYVREVAFASEGLIARATASTPRPIYVDRPGGVLDRRNLPV